MTERDKAKAIVGGILGVLGALAIGPNPPDWLLPLLVIAGVLFLVVALLILGFYY
jgi:hypothetical protein